MSAGSPPPTNEHRNVLLIISDDHGLADSGCYGNPVLKTPHMDILAKKGVRFTSAFSTVASCSASRSVIFTGLFNHTNGQYGHQHSPANLHTHSWVRGLPAVLNEQGYHTGLIGKFHVQPRQVYPFQELITSDVGYKSIKALQGNRDVWSMAQQAREFFSSGPERPFFLVINDAMVSYIDIMPTVLDWTGASPPPYDLPGRSILPVLEQENPAGWDTVFASHTFHEITMYYPMRVIRTRKYKYILNLAHKLDFPFASDLYESATWQGILRRGDKRMGVREVEKYIHRPKRELYDLENDPHEVVNVADNPQYKDILDNLRARLRKWQEDTNDPWIVKYIYE